MSRAALVSQVVLESQQGARKLAQFLVLGNRQGRTMQADQIPGRCQTGQRTEMCKVHSARVLSAA